MKVLHLDSGRTLRGGQIQVMHLLEGLERLGWDQVILARRPLQNAAGAGPLRAPTIYRQALKADIVHAHDAHSHTLASLLAIGKPLVVSRRVAFAPRRRLLTRLNYMRASRVLAVSEHVKGVLMLAGVADSRIEVVYDGIDIPEEEPPWRPSQGTPRVAILDSPDPQKRTAESVEACRLAGLEAVVERDLEAGLESADFFLYMPALEGFGSALLAAAVRKTPVVAAATGGIAEAVEDAQTGLLTDGSVEQAAAALRRLADDPALARSLAEGAYRRVVARFSSDIMVNRTAAVYRSLLSR